VTLFVVFLGDGLGFVLDLMSLAFMLMNQTPLWDA